METKTTKITAEDEVCPNDVSFQELLSRTVAEKQANLAHFCQTSPQNVQVSVQSDGSFAATINLSTPEELKVLSCRIVNGDMIFSLASGIYKRSGNVLVGLELSAPGIAVESLNQIKRILMD